MKAKKETDEKNQEMEEDDYSDDNDHIENRGQPEMNSAPNM